LPGAPDGCCCPLGPQPDRAALAANEKTEGDGSISRLWRRPISIALITGGLAVINLCGFPLLPGFLSCYLGADERQLPPASTRGLQGLLLGRQCMLSRTPDNASGVGQQKTGLWPAF
jgi:hypothetical protein